MTSLFPEFERNARASDLIYDLETILSHRVLIVGANPCADQLVTQLLAFGFRDIALWSHERLDEGQSKAEALLRSKNHISPYFRKQQGYHSLENNTISSSYDALGFGMADAFDPTIVINTQNNAYLSDVLMTHFLRLGQRLYIDAHTMSDHSRKLYGLNIQASTSESLSDEFSTMEERNLSLFDDAEHDPLLARVCASYVGAIAARYALRRDDPYFNEQIGFTLFPFAETPLQVGPAQREVRYRGFFKDMGIYLAGLGGGSLILDALVNVFDVKRLWGVDKDKLERTNLNRLIPFINDGLVGKKKTEAARIVYEDFAKQQGKDIRFIDGVIDGDLLIGDDARSIDIMLGMLSGADNKLNLVALSQKLSAQKKHLLVDVGVEPFRFDITNYHLGVTPCDHCRNLHDLAVTEIIAGHLPNCDVYVPGSTVFANSLGVLSLIEAMKYVDASLGSLATGSISGDLLPKVRDASRFYSVKQSSPDPLCAQHMRTTPLHVSPDDYHLEDGFDKGWNAMSIYGKDNRRLIGRFRYTPGVRGV